MIFFRLRMEKFWQNCQNCILFHQRNIVREFFWKKPCIFIIFCGFQAKTFRNGCQNRILIYQGNIVGELFCLKKQTNSYFFSGFGWTFFSRIVKLYSTLSEPPLKRNCLFAKNYRFIKFLRASGQKFAAM